VNHSVSSTKYFFLIINRIASFFATMATIAAAGVVLFALGFYVMPVFADIKRCNIQSAQKQLTVLSRI